MIPGMRQSDVFTFFSIDHLPLLDFGKEQANVETLFKLNRNFDDIKEAYYKLPKEKRPLIAKMVPLLPEGDRFRDLLDEAVNVRGLFAMHVRSFPEHPQLRIIPTTVKADNWIDDDTIQMLSYEWIKEAVEVIMQRSDGRGGDLPLPHTPRDTSQDSISVRARLNIRGALSAKTETAKTPENNSS